jgi:hypothetical protein
LDHGKFFIIIFWYNSQLKLLRRGGERKVTSGHVIKGRISDDASILIADFSSQFEAVDHGALESNNPEQDQGCHHSQFASKLEQNGIVTGSYTLLYCQY